MVANQALTAAAFAVVKSDWSEFSAESIAELFDDLG
jgi:hypothetical protein